jgi:hypothetical protein
MWYKKQKKLRMFWSWCFFGRSENKGRGLLNGAEVIELTPSHLFHPFNGIVVDDWFGFYLF